MQCKLCRDGKYTTVRVHRLVATAFVANPKMYDEVNHINFDRSDNRADNLEWISHKANVQYTISAGRHFCNKNLSGQNNPNYKGTKLKKYYEDHPDRAVELLARPRGQNGHAKPIKAFIVNTGDLVGNFDCLLDCADHLIELGYLSGKAKSHTYKMSISAHTGKPYHGLKFVYIS